MMYSSCICLLFFIFVAMKGECSAARSPFITVVIPDVRKGKPRKTERQDLSHEGVRWTYVW